MSVDSRIAGYEVSMTRLFRVLEDALRDSLEMASDRASTAKE